MKTRVLKNGIKNYGTIGDVTPLVAECGTVLQVGDVVDIDGWIRVVCKTYDGYFVMGSKGLNLNGCSNGQKDRVIKLIKRYYDLKVDDVIDCIKVFEIDPPNPTHTITIDGKEIVLSHELYLAFMELIKQFKDETSVADEKLYHLTDYSYSLSIETMDHLKPHIGEIEGYPRDKTKPSKYIILGSGLKLKNPSKYQQNPDDDHYYLDVLIKSKKTGRMYYTCSEFLSQVD